MLEKASAGRQGDLCSRPGFVYPFPHLEKLKRIEIADI